MISPTAENTHEFIPRGLVIRTGHGSQQRNSLVGPHYDGLSDTVFKEILEIRNFDLPRKRRDVQYAHIRTFEPPSFGLAATNRLQRKWASKTTPVLGVSGYGVCPPC